MSAFGELWTGEHDVYIKIAAVLDWAERRNAKVRASMTRPVPAHQQFDTTFVKHLRDWVGPHTQKQLDALDTVIARWHIKIP